MYIHIPKENRTNVDPSRRKGIFVGYSKSSKAYRIYFPGFKKIDISRDVKFNEDSTYNKSRKIHVEYLEEIEVPIIRDTTMIEENTEEDLEMEEPQEPIYPSHENNYYKRKLAWVCEEIQGAERYGTPEEMHRERTYSYGALLCDIIDK